MSRYHQKMYFIIKEVKQLNGDKCFKFGSLLIALINYV